MYNDTDSISAFHPVTYSQYSSTPSACFSPKTIPYSSNAGDENSDSVSKMMDSESRISSLKYKFNSFQDGITEIKRQANNAKTLAEISSFLKNWKAWWDIPGYL
jgi:hypothetical protein